MIDTASQNDKLFVNFCGLRFNTPLVLLSGCVGFGEEYTRIAQFANTDVGAVCLKGTTLHPRLGNRAPRVAETNKGLLNAIGLQNPGVNVVISDHLSKLSFAETRFIANIAAYSIDEYATLTRRFDDTPVDAIEINISCPNVKNSGAFFGNDPRTSAEVVEACRRETNKPLITKLSPNQADIAENARCCIEAGSDGLAVINTISGMSIDAHTRQPRLRNNHGGLSGPAIKPIALLKVHQVYQVAKIHDIPIIGQGGIASAEDALEFIIAGASAVGLGTVMLHSPLLCKKINASLLEYLDNAGLNNIATLVGSLILHDDK